MPGRSVGILAVIAALVALLSLPVYQRLVVLGFTRPLSSIARIHGLEKVRVIPETAFCEDLHYHERSKSLFTACQNDKSQRFQWFPAFSIFKDHKNLNQGTITVIDSTDFTVTKLQLDGFSGPLITHGIDILEDPHNHDTLYIFVINHLPNPDYYQNDSASRSSPNKARSQIEIFRHNVGSDSAQFLRSVVHPMIRTPNDIVAASPNTLYVTNDHYYREGRMRVVEDLLNQQTAAWSDTISVSITDLRIKDPTLGVGVTTALKGLHNNNGLGRGSVQTPDEIVLTDSSGGILTRAKRPLGRSISTDLKVVEQIQLDSALDNPFFYDDPYVNTKSNASGYILAGTANAHNLPQVIEDPTLPCPAVVWHVKSEDVLYGQFIRRKWEKRLIFQDDGSVIRGATSAVLVPIDPKTTNGNKQAWLFVTSFIGEAIIATKVEL